MAGAAVQQIQYCRAKETRAHAEQTQVHNRTVNQDYHRRQRSLSNFPPINRHEPTVISYGKISPRSNTGSYYHTTVNKIK